MDLVEKALKRGLAGFAYHVCRRCKAVWQMWVGFAAHCPECGFHSTRVLSAAEARPLFEEVVRLGARLAAEPDTASHVAARGDALEEAMLRAVIDLEASLPSPALSEPPALTVVRPDA